MTKFTKEIETKMRDLGKSLKLQLDFAKAADMTRPDDQLQFAQNNSRSAILMIDLIRELSMPWLTPAASDKPDSVKPRSRRNRFNERPTARSISDFSLMGRLCLT